MTMRILIATALICCSIPAYADEPAKKPARDTVAYCEALKRETNKPACFERAKLKAEKAEKRHAG